MVKYAAEVEYNGKKFHGFQKQPGLQTVQGAFERCLLTFTGREIRAFGAGRTDTGVHAKGQVISFEMEKEENADSLMKRMNSLLPDGAAVTQIAVVDDSFNPRRDAIWREYRYFFLCRTAPSPVLEDFSIHYPRPLDRDLMDKACSAVLGEHNFSAFRVKGQDESNVREVLRCEFTEDILGLLCLVVRANSFLYRMVRILGGAIISIGAGKMTLDEFAGYLEGGVEPCAEPLSPYGLFLWKVAYPPDKVNF
ncbi:MAG: tRNA pseudouridine(38-40) synthase TruA [Actinobacteria bacterium]|nr:tRNA pseudouridine(38-40) synthase TruA [Actinomycetota bacterium]